MHAISSRDAWVASRRGRIFARRWTPASATRDARPPIVLFHDSLGCVTLWRDFPERLAAATGREVVAYDRLGFGRSDAHPGRLDRRFVHDETGGTFRDLREQLDIGDFVAFGHSVGGGMAIACAAAHPAACRALITESAQTFVEDRTLQGIRDAQAAFARPGQIERLEKYHGDKAAWVLHAWIDTWLAPGFAGWNLDEALRAIRCPALAIHGDDDEYGSVRHPQRIAELAAGHASVEILHCGHVPHREQGDVVVEMTAAWLRQRG